MTPKTRALLWCLALLAASEVGLRVHDMREREPGVLGIDVPLVVLLGTSRTKHGLDPEQIEDALREDGINEVFVANVSQPAATNLGLLQKWAEDVLPLMGERRRGVVAIELRVEGFNDGYQAEGERFPRRLLERAGNDVDHLRLDDAFDLLSRGQLEQAAWWTLSRLRLTDLPAELRKLTREVPPPDPDEEAAELPDWARGERGFEGYPERRQKQDLPRVQDHYRDKVLANFEHGGQQTVAIEALIASVRELGMTPALYLMPVTDDHRTVYPRGLWDLVMAHITSFAAEQRVAFIDLDAEHGLAIELFHDTSHLQLDGAAIISRRLAERALAPVLR